MTGTFPATLTATERTCSATTGTAGSGLCNAASVVWAGGTDTDDACADIPTADTTEAKTATTATPTALGNNQYQVVWNVTVTNTGTVPTVYDLADTFHPGEGITLTSATLTSTAPDGIGDGAYNGGTDTTLATAQAIDGGATHTYTITSVFTVAPGASATATTCEGTTQGRGLFNLATLNGDQTASDCRDVPPGTATVTKTVATGPTYNPETGRYTISYTVTVTNPDAGPTVHDLHEAPSFGEGVTIASQTITQASTTTVPGVPKHYAVTVDLSLDAASADWVSAVTCSTEGAGTPGKGLFNRVAMDGDGDGVDNNDACIPIVTPPVDPPAKPQVRPTTGAGLAPFGLLGLVGLAGLLMGRRERF